MDIPRTVPARARADRKNLEAIAKIMYQLWAAKVVSWIPRKNGRTSIAMANDEQGDRRMCSCKFAVATVTQGTHLNVVLSERCFRTVIELAGSGVVKLSLVRELDLLIQVEEQRVIKQLQRRRKLVCYCCCLFSETQQARAIQRRGCVAGCRSEEGREQHEVKCVYVCVKQRPTTDCWGGRQVSRGGWAEG